MHSLQYVQYVFTENTIMLGRHRYTMLIHIISLCGFCICQHVVLYATHVHFLFEFDSDVDSAVSIVSSE